MAHPGGRPRKYKNKLELEKIVNDYFNECDPHWLQEDCYDYPLLDENDQERLEAQPHGGALKRSSKRDYNAEQTLQTRWVKTEQEPYTMAGLALRLGLSRQGLMEYKRSQEFSDTIISARQKVGEYNERMLHKGKNAAGAIFNLKVNFGYHEEIEDNPPPENPIIFINNVPITPNEPKAQED